VDENTGWAVGQDYSNGKMILLHTKDAGENWIQQTVPDINAYLSTIKMKNENDGYALGTQYSKAVGLYTNDGGLNWMEQSFPEEVTFIEDFTIIDEMNAWALGLGDSTTHILALQNDSTWINAYSLTGEEIFSAIDMIDSEFGWVAGTDWKEEFGVPFLLNTNDGGKNWEKVMLPVETGLFADVSFINRDTGWVAGSTNSDFLILETKDGGENWTISDSLGIDRSKHQHTINNRFGKFNKVNQLEFLINTGLVCGIISNRFYDEEGLESSKLKLLVLNAYLKKYDLGSFKRNIAIVAYIHAYNIIKNTLRNNLNIAETNDQNLEAGELICYSFGHEELPDFKYKPVIFKKKIMHSFLNKISITLEDQVINVGDSVLLTVVGIDQYGEEMDIDLPVWLASGGGRIESLNGNTYYIAEEAGDYFISCHESFLGLADSIKVTIHPNTGNILR